MKKNLYFLFFFGVSLSLASFVYAQDNPSSREKILLVREQALQDRQAALELKTKAETQIGNAQAILARAQSSPDDPSLKNREQVIALAPGALKYGQEVLAKAEKALAEADLKFRWSERALKYLPEPAAGEPMQYSAGGAFPLSDQQKGRVEVIRPNKNEPASLESRGILPGSYLKTSKDAVVQIMTFFRPEHLMTIGPETEIGLQSDNPKETRWGLMAGKIHMESLDHPDKSAPLINTPKGVVESTPGSEFDVEVKADGQTLITPYKGDVKLVAYKDQVMTGEELFPAKTETPLPAPWWKKAE